MSDEVHLEPYPNIIISDVSKIAKSLITPFSYLISQFRN